MAIRASTHADVRSADRRDIYHCEHPLSAQAQQFGTTDYITGAEFAIVRCQLCGLVRTYPRPPVLGDYYPLAYYAQGKRFAFFVEEMLRRLADFRAAAIEAETSTRVGSVLDIGCGRGVLLDSLRRRGWKTYGTELSTDSAHYARSVLGLDVRLADVCDLPFDAGQFDAVVMWHVLEHIAQPQSVLDEVSRVLRPGGVLLVAVPNFASWEARVTRGGWFHLDVPRHATHFTTDSLVRLLRADGFQPIRMSHWAPEYDAFSFAQSLLNGLGTSQNLLYDMLRDKRAKVSHRKARFLPAQLAATLALAPVLLSVGAVVTPILGLAGQGATTTVWARKAEQSLTALRSEPS